ncbi:hypothetical protein FB107DRAFT_252657, partial [Schizophyllum commune]
MPGMVRVPADCWDSEPDLLILQQDNDLDNFFERNELQRSSDKSADSSNETMFADREDNELVMSLIVISIDGEPNKYKHVILGVGLRASPIGSHGNPIQLFIATDLSNINIPADVHHFMPWLKRYQAHPLYDNNAYILHDPKSGEPFIISAEAELPNIPRWDRTCTFLQPTLAALNWSLKATVDSAKSLPKLMSKLRLFADKLKAKMKKLVLDCFLNKRTIPDSSSFRFVSEFPIYPTDSASFRFPEFPAINKFIDNRLKDSVIEESNSSWASNLLPVRKKDDMYPPCIEDCYATLQDKKLFISINLKSGYWQVHLKDDVKVK